jgi:hypothetical protein
MDNQSENARFVTCQCQHGAGGIEFDTSQLDERETRPVECPHCGLKTTLSRQKSLSSPPPRLQTSPEKSIQVEGTIGYFGLIDWWLTEFTDEEREYIDLNYNPMGAPPRSLTISKISWTTQTTVSLLTGLAGWFSKADASLIRKRFIKKLIEVIDLTDSDIIDVHFAYAQLMEIYYRARNVDPSALERAIWACEKQIAIAAEAAKAFQEGDFPEPKIPYHKGYEQLAIILERQKNYAAVIRLCNQAKEQRWCGDWEHRIERCERKLYES